MIVRRFVKRSLDNKKKIFLILLSIAVGTGLSAFAVQYFFGESSVYRSVEYYEVKPVVSILTGGMAVEVAVWDGEEIKIETVAELPIFVDDESEQEIIISQNDDFVVSIFTLDMFRYKLKVYLPVYEYKEINIISAGGNVNVDSYRLESERVLIDTKNADVDVRRATGIYVINTVSGDVYLDYDFLVAAAVVESDSGNVQVCIPYYYADRANAKLRVRTRTGSYEIIEKDEVIPLL